MKSIVIPGPKDLRIEERDAGDPDPGEVRVRLAVDGNCGSDLHYYNHGGFGAVRLKEPMALGHEVSGHIEALGAGVSGLSVDQLVAVSQSRPCGHCRYCAEGLRNHCLNMRFYGSAMPFLHIQGAFCKMLVADAAQCVPADGLSAGEAALAEPLAVYLHAARRAGAAEIVATDLSSFTLDMASRVGADRTINTREEPGALAPYATDKEYFDTLFECSGAAVALAGAIPALRPRAVVMQLGLGCDMTVPMGAITAEELDLRGSFRFHEEYAVGGELMKKRLVDVSLLITRRCRLPW